MQGVRAGFQYFFFSAVVLVADAGSRPGCDRCNEAVAAVDPVLVQCVRQAFDVMTDGICTDVGQRTGDDGERLGALIGGGVNAGSRI